VKTGAKSETTPGPAPRAPMGLLVSRFIRFYGMDAWTNPTWPTRDRVIPFKLFFAMLIALTNIEAGEQVQAYHAALLAGAMIHGGEDGRATRERHVEQLLSRAYPTIPPGTPATHSDGSSQ
jgi:hypothetical protein